MKFTTLQNILRQPALPTIKVDGGKVSVHESVIGDLYSDDNGCFFDINLEDYSKSFNVTSIMEEVDTAEKVVTVVFLRNLL